jgi:AraC-like DNA-binding protein
MLIKFVSLVLFLMLAVNANAQITDAQNLTKDVEALMYSDPEKALKTAQYIVSNQSFGTQEDVYNSCLLQAEIYIDLERYNDAVIMLISADRISQNIRNEFLSSKNEYLIGKIYLKMGFTDAVEKSIQELDKSTESLKGEEKNVVNLWRDELAIHKLFSEKKYKECLALIQKNKDQQSKLYPTFGMQLRLIQSKINNKPAYLSDFKDNSYFKFLSEIVILKLKIKSNDFQESDLLDLKKKYPRYNDIFYKDLYQNWSQKVCSGNSSEDCFRVRKEYIRILKLSIADQQNARVNVINLVDQNERHKNLTEKNFQNKILLVLFVMSIISIVSLLIYFLILRSKANMENAEWEKKVIYEEYEQKLSDQLKDFQTSNAFVIPEKTENLILSKLKVFESSKEVTNPHLSLAVLAKRLDTNSKYLSEIINKHKEKNFSNYLNELRVKYIVDKLENNPEYLQYKTSYLAEEAGFASRTTFTTIFKNVTGTSPSQFIEQLKNK